MLQRLVFAAVIATPALAAADAAIVDPPRPDPRAGIAVQAHEPKTARARAIRRSGGISIDGRLDDAAWKAAPVSNGFVQRFPDEGKPPTHATEFRVLYDDHAIYVAVRAFDSAPEEIRGLLTRRDQNSPSDWIEVGVDSYHDRRTAFVFAINPAGVQRDFLIFDDQQTDEGWDAVWTAAAATDGEGWTAELRVPLSQLRFSAREEQAWGLQVVRTVARTGEQSSWSPWPRAGSQIVSVFGTLDDIQGLEPGRRLEVLPYVTTGLALLDAADGDPFHDSAEGRFNSGLDVRYGLSSAFTLAAAVNPDFGQVEADPSQVNLTANETFLPEKRPFFLEGTDIFRYSLQQGDGGGGEGLFYTRRIGAAPHLHGANYADYTDTPAATTIYGAAKISGKTENGLSVGVLEAVTAEEVATLEGAADPAMDSLVVEPLTNYALVRVLKDLRGGKSQVGTIVTAVNRKLDTPELSARLHDQAYAAGLDVTHRFWNDLWSASVKAHGSWVHGSEAAMLYTQTRVRHLYQRVDATHLELDPTATSMAGAGLLWDVGRWNHRRWQFGTGGDLRTPGLEVNDMGFQHGADGAVQWIWGGFRDNEPSAQVLNWGLNHEYWISSDFEPRLGGMGTNVNGYVTLANHWSVNAGVNYNNNVWNAAELRGGPRLRQEDGYNGWFGVSTDARKKVSGGLNLNLNRRAESDSWSGGAYGWLQVQARSNVELSLSPSLFVSTDDHQYITEVVDDDGMTRYVMGRIHQVIPSVTVRGSWTFSPRLSLQVYAQPFIAAGEYLEFKEAADTYAADYEDRFAELAADQIDEVDGELRVDRDGDGTVDYTFGKPDFNVRELRSNVVLRWEYRPGSTVFFIWSHSRAAFEDHGILRPRADLDQLANERGEHVVMVKANYWVGL